MTRQVIETGNSFVLVPAVPVIPGTPSTPTRTGRSETSLSLRTTAGSGGAATSYRWRYSTNSTVSNSDPMVTSTGPIVTIPGLTAGTNYWIDVRADNDAGSSDYSGNLATVTSGTAPPPPTTVSANAGSNVSVGSGGSVSIGGSDTVTNGRGSTTISWTKRSGTGSSLSSTSAASPTFTAPTVSSQRTIIWRKTVTNNGVSDTDDVTITVTVAATQAPGTPSTPSATSRGETSLTLSTTAGGGGAATGYRWRISTNSVVSNSDAIHTSTGPSITITGLNSNDNYWVDVRAENGGGNSAYSGDLATSTTAGTTTDPVDPVLPATTVSANAGPDVSMSATGSVVIGGSDTITNPVGPTTYSWVGQGGSTSVWHVSSPTISRPTIVSSYGGRSDSIAVWTKTTTNNGVSDTDTVTIIIRGRGGRGSRGNSARAPGDGTYRLTVGAEISSALRADPNSPAYLSYIEIDGVNEKLNIFIGSTPTDRSAGTDLSSQWETAGRLGIRHTTPSGVSTEWFEAPFDTDDAAPYTNLKSALIALATSDQSEPRTIILDDNILTLRSAIGSSGGLLPKLYTAKLSVDIGSSGGMLPKLDSGRPRRLCPTQTLTLPVSGYSLQFSILKNWEVRPAPAIDFDLAPPGDLRWFQGLHLFSSGQAQARFASNASGQSVHHAGDDLSDQVESQGQLVLQYGTNVLVLNMVDGVDGAEPYDWVASDEAAAFYRAIPAAGAEITLTINGCIPVPPAADVLLSANTGSSGGVLPNLHLTQPAIQLRADIGTIPALAPNLRVVNPAVNLSVDIGSGLGFAPKLKVLNLIPFDLSWASEGRRTVYVSAVVTAGTPTSNGTVYENQPGRTPFGSVLAGSDLESQTGQSVTAIALNELFTGNITFWDVPSTLNWSDFFRDNPDVSLWMQFAPGGSVYPFVSRGSGGNYSAWATGDLAAQAAVTAARAEGARFAFVLRGTPHKINLSVDIGSGSGLTPHLRVLNPFRVTMGPGAGITSNIKVFNPFSLSAWERRDYSAPIVLASLRSTVAGVDITVDPVVIAAGELDVVTGLMITQVERFRNGEEIRLRRKSGAGTVNFNTAFGGNNIYAKAKLIIVLEDDDDRTQIVFNQSNQGGGFSNWLIQDATHSSLINGIQTGDNFLLAIALPALELNILIKSSLAFAPKLQVLNPIELGSNIGTSAGLIPNLHLTQPAIQLRADIGTIPALAPNLRVVNPAIYLSADIGTKLGFAPRLRVLNPFQVTMGSSAGASPNLAVFVEAIIEMNVSMGAGAGIVPRLFDEDATLSPVGIGGGAGLGVSLRVGKNISVAVSMGGAVRSIQNLIVSNPTIIIGTKPMVAWAMEIVGVGLANIPYRVWSGLGQLDWNGVIWDGTQSVNGSFVSVSPVTDKVGAPDRRASVTISVTAEMIRQLLAIDTGPVSVFLRYLYSLDNGVSWIEAPMVLAGRLSQPKFDRGLYTVEIETWSGDVDRGEPKLWSDETQRAEYPGDKGFEFIRGLSQGIDTRWPP